MKTKSRLRLAFVLRILLIVVACAVVVSCSKIPPGGKRPPKPGLDVIKPPIESTATPVTVQKKCPLESNAIRKVPSYWVYCPYDGGKLETTTLPKTKDTLAGTYMNKYCTTQGANIGATDKWTHCVYDGQPLQ